jgi:hypothetical protein
MERRLRKHVDTLGWLVVILGVIAVLVLRLR